MKRVLKTPLCHVFDDFLPQKTWRALWAYMQKVPLMPVDNLRGRAWRLEDGQPFSGPVTLALSPRVDLRDEEGKRYRVLPPDSPLEGFLEQVIKLAPSIPEMVGKTPQEWEAVSGRAYVYGVSTALAWHQDDNSGKTGAYVYYVHPRWNASWGGELLVANPPPGKRVKGRRKRPDTRFDNEAYSELLQRPGTGTYVLAKPNRLVFIGAADHCITPVTRAAGAAVRATIAGFFVRDAQKSIAGDPQPSY